MFSISLKKYSPVGQLIFFMSFVYIVVTQFWNNILYVQKVSNFNKSQLPNSSPAFGNIPVKRVEKLSNRYSTIIAKSNNAESFPDLMEKYQNSLMKILGKETFVRTNNLKFLLFQKKLKELFNHIPFIKKNSEQENKTLKALRHEYKNEFARRVYMALDGFLRDRLPEFHPKHPDSSIINNDKMYFDFQKQELKDMFKYVNKNAQLWKNMDVWRKNPETIVSAKMVFEKLYDAVTFIERPQIIVKNENFLSKIKVKNPAQAYDLYSQIIFNAIKYSDNKPILVEFKKLVCDGEEKLFVSVTNLETKPLSASKIDELNSGIIKTSSKKSENGLFSSGFGIPEVVSIMKNNGCEKHIATLFEKGRESGVCVNVPIIGVV